jgi:N-acetylgalactosamine PTS system EIIA component
MTEATKPKAIVIGHGGFANGMVMAVQKITGQGDALLPLSGQEHSLAQIEAMLRASIQTSGVTVIFTDLQAGSSTMAARKAVRDLPHIVLVVGANLPMLLDFVLSNAPTAAEAARHAADRGRSAIVVYGGAA